VPIATVLLNSSYPNAVNGYLKQQNPENLLIWFAFAEHIWDIKFIKLTRRADVKRNKIHSARQIAPLHRY